MRWSFGSNRIEMFKNFGVWIVEPKVTEENGRVGLTGGEWQLRVHGSYRASDPTSNKRSGGMREGRNVETKMSKKMGGFWTERSSDFVHDVVDPYFGND